MWESPIQMITDDIIKDIVQKQDELLMESVHRVGFNIDRDELAKALNYDRHQYEKGYADGRSARDSEIVRCKDCKWHDDDFCLYLDVMGFYDNDYCSLVQRKETEDDTTN